MNEDEGGTIAPLDVEPGDVEQWVSSAAGVFEESYRYLRSRFSLRPKPAFVAAWMSLHKDDRGTLQKWEDVAEYLGVSRQTVYGWRGIHRLDDHAELLRLMRMRGDALGEVDRVTYIKASSGESTVSERELFYKRAGVLGQPMTLDEQAERSQLEGWLQALREAGEPGGDDEG